MSQRIAAALAEAESGLASSIDADYELDLRRTCLAEPAETIQAICRRGWQRRGDSEALNIFLVRLLATIWQQGPDGVRAEALARLVEVFTEPDDNTTGWSQLLETAAGLLADERIAEARPLLEMLRPRVRGRNVQAVDFALKRLNDACGPADADPSPPPAQAGPVAEAPPAGPAAVATPAGQLRVGMLRLEVEAILGPATAESDGGQALAGIERFDAAPGVLAKIRRQRFVLWKRPEGTYRLIFVADQLAQIHSVP